MNTFTKLSIELANQRDYLDQLFRVYPLAPDCIKREIPESLWNRIKAGFEDRNNKELFRALLELKLFPIKDSYVAYFRRDPGAIDRNPSTVNRICGRVRELGLDQLYESIRQPKETNRQIGPLFKKWVESGALGVFPVCEEEFFSTEENAILRGGDKLLKTVAKERLNFTRRDNKGLDFVGRFNGKYVVGESKFITDEGGHQNAQFGDALQLLRRTKDTKIVPIAILDGTLYIPGNKKLYKAITSKNLNVMSALLLREFLYSL